MFVFYPFTKMSTSNKLFVKILVYNVNTPIEVLLIICYQMTLIDKESTKMKFI